MSLPAPLLPSERVDFLPEAQIDIEELGLYFSERAPEVENRFYQAIDKTVRVLARSPNLGERFPTQNPKLQGMRVWRIDGFPNHLIFYHSVGDRLEILRVFHGARDYATILDDESSTFPP